MELSFRGKGGTRVSVKFVVLLGKLPDQRIEYAPERRGSDDISELCAPAQHIINQLCELLIGLCR
ncbi:hypothetical protein GS493_20540 [Rhodococcus hoagii]|nr:hypothetical protein [Prescottella equi]